MKRFSYYLLISLIFFQGISGLFVGAMLLIWIGVEIAMVGYHSSPPLQLVYGLMGVAILILTPMPSVKYRFKGNTLNATN
jgi:hypothetical protein